MNRMIQKKGGIVIEEEELGTVQGEGLVDSSPLSKNTKSLMCQL